MSRFYRFAGLLAAVFAVSTIIEALNRYVEQRWGCIARVADAATPARYLAERLSPFGRPRRR